MKPIYVLGSRSRPTCEAETTDSFVTNAVNLCLMLAGEFDVRLVGTAGSGVPGVETIEWAPALARLAAEPDTAVVAITGPDHLAEALQLPQTLCEPTRGYDAPVFTRHVAFPSWAWLHFSVGLHRAPDGWQNWRMIPHAIVPERFTYKEEKEGYVLFLSRLNHGKGLETAVAACRLAGKRLVVAGTWHGPESQALLGAAGDQIEYVGFADYHARRQLLAGAEALLYPTPVLEPFGYTVLEANVSGTPALVTDWGAFTETVADGVNGFRCRSFADFAAALGRLGEIRSRECREWALERFGREKVAPRCREFFAPLVDA